MQRRSLAILGLCVALVTLQASTPAFAAPPYAVAGAFASYTAQGGFIAYFSGVEGNLTYTITSVFGNGSMKVELFENITAGSDLNPQVNTSTLIDSVQNPKSFPAVPLANMSTLHLVFQSVRADFVQNSTVSVPAGVFDTAKFTGKDSNGTAYTFWFDRATGLMIEESAGTSVMELDSSNIAVPIGTAGFYSSEVPYEMVFVAAFVIGGGLFLYMRHHYTSAASKEAMRRKQRKDSA